MSDVIKDDHQRRWQIAAFALVVLFTLATLPYLIWPLGPHPDETRYTVSAVQMVENGEYFVPRTAEGDLRLKKPPLTYFYVIAGFALLGENQIGAKAFILLSALGILWLTFRLARVSGASARNACLAMAAVAGHGVFFTTSTQHIPDMPLILGTTAALLGFVMILRGAAPNWAYYLAWLGIAWAVLAKGMLAILLVVLVIPFRVFGAKPRTSGHEAVAVCLAMVLASVWFIAIWFLYPAELAAQFLGDQVSQKADFALSGVLAGILKNSKDLFLPASPVLLGSVLVAFSGKKAFVGSSRKIVFFLLAWCALNLILFAFSNQLYERYILPAAPAFGVLLALMVGHASDDAFHQGLKKALLVTFWVPVAVLLIVGTVTFGFGDVGWASASFTAALIITAAVFRARRSSVATLLALAMIMPFLDLAMIPLKRTVYQYEPSQIAADAGVANAENVVVLGVPSLLDIIGLRSGTLSSLAYANGPSEPALQDATLVFFTNTDFVSEVEALGFNVETKFTMQDIDLQWDELVRGMTHGDLALFVRETGKPFYVARRD